MGFFPEYKYIAVGGPLFCHYHYYLGRYILNWEKVQEQFMKLKIYWRLKFADNTKTLWTFEERVKNPNDYLYSCLNGKYIKQASEYLRKTAKIKQY